MSNAESLGQEGFRLGNPVLVCRWRLYNRMLPLENRHLRALARRKIDGVPVSPELVAWAKQHIEWTLADGAAQHPNGVLMLVVDDAGRAAMTVGQYRSLGIPRRGEMLHRAQLADEEAQTSGVAPETLWTVEGNVLAWCTSPEYSQSGATSLIYDLADTMGMPIRHDEDLIEKIQHGEKRYDELLLVSDEHGVVRCADALGPRGERFADGYHKLLSSFERKR